MKTTPLLTILLFIFLSIPLTAQAQNYSLSFDGSGDYIEIPDADVLSPSSFTIEFWVKQPALSSGRNTYLQKRSASSGSGVEVAFMENAPGADEGIYSYVESQFFASGSHPTANTWTHIAVTFNSATDLMEIFVQGVSAGTATITTEIVNTDGKLYLGWYPGDPSYNALTGTIDELRISDNVRYTSDFTAPSSEFITDGNTIALYHFDEGCGSIVTDASGNGNHGTINNAKWSTDTAPLSENYVLSFDGVDDYVQVNNFSNQLFTNELTLECWLKVENGKGHVLSKRNGNSIDFHLEVAPQNQKLYAHLGDLGDFFGTTALSNNTWYHVAVTYDNQSIKIFLNGTLDGELPATGNIGTNSSTLNIGSGDPGGAYFDGLINELRISNIARYTSDFTPPGNEFEPDNNTVALYHFNEGSGSTVDDASSNSNDGIINGASWTTESSPACEISWQLQIRAGTSHSNDNDNILGVSKSATDGFDNDYDEVEPPLPAGNYLSVTFPHADWNNSLGDNFTKDIRDSIDLSDVMQVWNFEVKSSTSEDVTLTFFNTVILTVPVILENRATGERKILSDNSAYTFTAVADSAHAFRISVGDTVAPQLTLGSSCSGARILLADSTHVLDWTMSDGNGVDSVFVWFSADSGATYSSVASLGTVSMYNWQVPDYDLNHKCMIKVKAQDYAGNNLSKSSDHVFTIAGDSLVASVAAGWSLWGAPIKPRVDSMAVNLGDDLTDYWVTYAYADSGYTFADKLSATQGCWLGTLENATIDVLGTPLTSNKTVDLSVGWDLVSNPLVLDVAVDSLQFEKGGVLKSKAEAVAAGWINTIYGYGSSGYSEASTLEPWKAYWVSVLENAVSMTFPIHRQNSPAPGTSFYSQSGHSPGEASITDWQITFRANTEDSRDNSTVIGMTSEATDAFDNYIDVVKPPSPPSGASYTSLSILHPEWRHPLGQRFAVDFRGDTPVEDSQEWHLLVESSNPEVDLAWTIENLPPEIQVGIDLTGDGNFEDMRTISSVKVSANSSIAVRLLDTITGIEDEPTLPTEYAIQQNYPNPFNPETTISYQLPKAGRVELSLYNVLGELVRTIVAEDQEAGFHKVVLDGGSLSSGVYYYRISAGDYARVRKATLLK